MGSSSDHMRHIVGAFFPPVLLTSPHLSPSTSGTVCRWFCFRWTIIHNQLSKGKNRLLSCIRYGVFRSSCYELNLIESWAHFHVDLNCQTILRTVLSPLPTWGLVTVKIHATVQACVVWIQINKTRFVRIQFDRPLILHNTVLTELGEVRGHSTVPPQQHTDSILTLC
jgi:hypothetical protein